MTTAADGKRYKIRYYNLDVIISVGYRIKSHRGTQFRIWATSVLKDHLIKGYPLNQKGLAEKGTKELQQVLSLLSRTLENHNLVNDEGRAVLDIVNRHAGTWRLLLQYDEDNLPAPDRKLKCTPCGHPKLTHLLVRKNGQYPILWAVLLALFACP